VGEPLKRNVRRFQLGKRLTSQNRKIRFLLCAIIVAWFVCSSRIISAQKRVLRFDQFPVTKIYRGKFAPLKLTANDEAWRERFQWAIKNLEVDYAGHYIVYTWSCGSECATGVVINAKNGRVSWLDVRLNYGVEKPVDYRVNSSLMILSGCRGEKKTGIHYYRIKQGRFVHLRSVLNKQRHKPDCS
jgi:hypothetical protein